MSERKLVSEVESESVSKVKIDVAYHYENDYDANNFIYRNDPENKPLEYPPPTFYVSI